jgi:sulfatase modifying factor 1
VGNRRHSRQARTANQLVGGEVAFIGVAMPAGRVARFRVAPRYRSKDARGHADELPALRFLRNVSCYDHGLLHCAVSRAIPGAAVMGVHRLLECPRLFVVILAVAGVLPLLDLRADEPDRGAAPASDSMLGKEVGQVRNDNRLKMKLVWCPPGKFIMGSPESEVKRGKNEGPQVDVTLTQGFWLGKFEVTQPQWESLVGTTPWKGQTAVQEGDDYPATYVNAEEALEFCHKFTDLERKAGRLPEAWEYTLPTEAQWEYACRAGTTTRFSFGDDASELATYAWFGRVYGEDGLQVVTDDVYAHEVGLKKPNPWGLHDMHGNVWEWCRDWYSVTIDGGMDPTGPDKGSERVMRGGSFFEPSPAVRSARRDGPMAAKRNSGRQNYVGFRVACSPVPKKK